MKEESKFKDMYTPSKDDIRVRKSSMQNQEHLSKMIFDKEREDSTRLQNVIGQLKNKANKKCHFKLFKNIDTDKLMQM